MTIAYIGATVAIFLVGAIVGIAIDRVFSRRWPRP